MPTWMNAVAFFSLLLAILCAGWIAVDEWRHPQKMAIMNVVWPITALYSGPIGLWAYFSFGRPRPKTISHRDHKPPESGSKEPHPMVIAKGATHCGAGCTLGDIIAESLLIFVPGLAMVLGWRSLWQEKIFSAWILDFILAFSLGIIFQYFSIRPMHQDLPRGQALVRALQADTLSLVAWQIGMYAIMALAHFWIFPDLLGSRLKSGSLVFWWVMQFAMMAGFLTAYPVNRWLIVKGVKEAM